MQNILKRLRRKLPVSLYLRAHPPNEPDTRHEEVRVPGEERAGSKT